MPRGKARRGLLSRIPAAPLDVDVGGARLEGHTGSGRQRVFLTHGNISSRTPSRESLGADDDIGSRSRNAASLTCGKDTFVGSIRLGTDLGSTCQFYDQFEAGRVPESFGLQARGAARNVSALFRIDRRLAKPGAKVGLDHASGVGVGASQRPANVGDGTRETCCGLGRSSSGSIRDFARLPSGYAMGEAGESQVYFIGRPF